jgi:hypothetical protein
MSTRILILIAACLLALAGQSQASKVMVAPGKTECISQNMEAAHFEVSTLSLDPRNAGMASMRSDPHCCCLTCCPQQVSGAARVEGAVFVTPRYPNYQPSTTLRVRTLSAVLEQCPAPASNLGRCRFRQHTSAAPRCQIAGQLSTRRRLRRLSQPLRIPVDACSCTARLASRSGLSKASHQKHTLTLQHTGQACTSFGKHLPKKLWLSTSAA